MGATDELISALLAARRECDENMFRLHQDHQDHRAKRPAHDLSEASRDDRKRLYHDARSGRHGEGWQQLALSEEMGVWLWFYEWWSHPPSDKQLARMWPTTNADYDEERKYRERGLSEEYSDFDAAGLEMRGGY